MKSTEKTGSEKDSVSITVYQSNQQSDSISNDQDTKKNETGGYEKKAAEPTRYGDWEIAGRCIDF